MGDEIPQGRRNEYLIHCYVAVCKSVEERVQKTLLWKNAKPSLPGSPCHCRCHGVAPHSVAATAVAAVSLLSARHTGVTRSDSNMRPLNEEKMKALKEYLEVNEKWRWIRSSISPAGVSIHFVKQKDGGLQLCVDY